MCFVRNNTHFTDTRTGLKSLQQTSNFQIPSPKSSPGLSLPSVVHHLSSTIFHKLESDISNNINMVATGQVHRFKDSSSIISVCFAVSELQEERKITGVSVTKQGWVAGQVRTRWQNFLHLQPNHEHHTEKVEMRSRSREGAEGEYERRAQMQGTTKSSKNGCIRRPSKAKVVTCRGAQGTQSCAVPYCGFRIPPVGGREWGLCAHSPAEH